jgi:predicted nucleotide-binding protein
MENLTGSWSGELNGTNQGNMFIRLQHEGDRIYGEGAFNEPQLGTYQYSVHGIVTGEAIKLMLTPSGKDHAGIALGNVEANAKLDSDGRIVGSWQSSVGTKGNFYIGRVEKEQATSAKHEDEGHKPVFIVHGQDDATKEKVARFVERLDLEATILHEQVSKGMTIIEKFEEYSKRAGFAVVLFTPDDVAYPLGKEEERQSRARQNVVLEMGYFIGLLGRDRVCVLYKGDLELPTDILGVVYTKIDDGEAWKLSLAKELKTANYNIDLNKLMP